MAWNSHNRMSSNCLLFPVFWIILVKQGITHSSLYTADQNDHQKHHNSHSSECSMFICIQLQFGTRDSHWLNVLRLELFSNPTNDGLSVLISIIICLLSIHSLARARLVDFYFFFIPERLKETENCQIMYKMKKKKQLTIYLYSRFQMHSSNTKMDWDEPEWRTESKCLLKYSNENPECKIFLLMLTHRVSGMTFAAIEPVNLFSSGQLHFYAWYN